MITNGVHKRADALRLADPVAPQGLKNAQKGLLPDIVNGLTSVLARAKLDQNQFAEITVEVLLCCRIAARQAF